jgi:hypothetical protein
MDFGGKLKKCSKCDSEKPAREFVRVVSACRSCLEDRAREEKRRSSDAGSFAPPDGPPKKEEIHEHRFGSTLVLCNVL